MLVSPSIGFFMIQLDLFQEYSEDEELRREVKKLHESSEKVRRGIFARHNELSKLYLELNYRLEIIERNICQGK